MVRDKDHISLFNMPLEKTVDYDKDKNLVQDIFKESVKMSTYLVAFVVCDYAKIKNSTKKGIQVNISLIRINLIIIDYINGKMPGRGPQWPCG